MTSWSQATEYYAARLITQEWVEAKDAEHRLFPAASDVKDSEGHVLVTAYAVFRPDGQWSLMIINKDYDNPHAVRAVFHDGDTGIERRFAGEITMLNFGKTQYQWHAARKKGFADPDNPPLQTTKTVTADTLYTLPPASITILRGRIEPISQPH